MSSIGNWAYVNEVTVRPFIEYMSNGKAKYGDPFKIKCYFTGKREILVSDSGAESVSTMMYLTEFAGIKELDLVGGKPVKYVEPINSTPLEETVIDYRIYT